MQTQTQTSPLPASPLPDILQQFDGLLKNHSIVVSDRENLTLLFEKIVELCTQMSKTKLKAAIKAATQSTKPKAQPKTKLQPTEIMMGPDGAADAPVISDLQEMQVARGRGRPRKAAVSETIAPASAAEAPNAETAEKKRRGRPKKDKTVTISSNDDEDALIEKMMADVASMQKDEEVHPAAAGAAPVVAVVPVVPDDETETEDEMTPIQTFSGELMRSDSMSSMSPVIHNSVAASFDIVVEADVAVNVNASVLSKDMKEPKAKEPKAKEPKAKEPKAKVAKAKEPKAKEPKSKEPKAKEPKAKEPKAKEPKALPSFSAHVPAPVPESIVVASNATNVVPLQENRAVNGMLYLTANFPRSSFTYNGRTFLRTDTDNVYDTMTHEMIGVWDHANHEIIHAFDEDDEDMLFSDEE